MPKRYQLIAYSETEQLANRLTCLGASIISPIGLVVLWLRLSVQTTLTASSVQRSSLAVAGAVFKSFMTHRLAFLTPAFRIGLGWLIVVGHEGLLTMVRFICWVRRCENPYKKNCEGGWDKGGRCSKRMREHQAAGGLST